MLSVPARMFVVAAAILLAGSSPSLGQRATPYTSSLQPGEALVAGSDYSHFPRLAMGKSGRLGILYYHGRNHGSRDDEALALPRRLANSAGRQLKLDGDLVSEGQAIFPAPVQLVIAAQSDERHVRFQITGLDGAGRVVTETVEGPASKRTFTRTKFKIVKEIVAEGNSTGPISIGIRTVPSNVEFKYSDDSGKSWSGPIALCDGLTADDRFCYAPALAGLPDGTFIALYLTIDLASGRISTMQRVSSDNGATWSQPQSIKVTGASPTTTLNVWGQIQVTESGRLVAMAYAGQENWVFVSSDKGTTWQAHMIVRTASPSVDYNEMAVGIVSEAEWIGLARGGDTKAARGFSMRQFATVDHGASWQDLGDPNVMPSGGYVSPTLQVAHCGSNPTVVWMYMARNSRSRPPPWPDSLIMHTARSSAALKSARSWSEGHIVGARGAFTNRSGYPSVILDADCRGGTVVAGRETSMNTAQIVAFRFSMPE